jgi:hypothetical protein
MLAMSENMSGRAKGAKVLAEMMSPEERKDRAKKAAIARWGTKPPRAIHNGNFKEEFGFDVDCYVLNDEHKTAVIHQRGMNSVLGFSPQSGGNLPRFIGRKNIFPYISSELREKLQNPIAFYGLNTVSEGAPSRKKSNMLHGYDVTILIDLCKAIIAAEADGKLKYSQAKTAKQAHIIVNASAKVGIKGLVYALSGYDATREEIITAFKFYVREEAREYEKEFPDQLYAQWYRLYGLPILDRGRPWKFKELTETQVYYPLAKSKGKIHELIVAQRAASGDRGKKLHQFLSEVGVKALRTHLGQLLGIAQVSRDSYEYERYVNKVFGDQREFDFTDPVSSTNPEAPSEE